MENRNLAKKPELSWDNIMEGKFTSELESYISDQLFAKDALVSAKTDLDRLLGKTYMNGVYLIKDSDGRLRYVQKYTENREQLAANAASLNEFAEKVNVPVDFMLVPNVSAYMLDKLPAGADCDDQSESLDYVKTLVGDKINFYPMLDKDGFSENLYFRTDHHWSFRGAQKAVGDYLVKSGQISDAGKLDIPFGKTHEGFLGTLYSKAPSSFAEPDEFEFCTAEDAAAEVEWVNEGKKSDSIIDSSFLDKKDKYAALFGGNFGQVRIKTGREGGKVLVLKDSYANAAMQFLMQQYSEITMIDLRYYHMQEKDVSELCSEYGVDRVIMLYNLDFLNEDRNFVWLT